jgi:NAD(P)-dependent dehydrogenase (short-subunit alcohol dehydrogenase family)
MAESQMKHVFITGASRGIGLFLAARFLRGGYKVLAGARDPNSIRRADLLKGAHVVSLDVTSAQSIAQAVHQAREITPALDILINNAGVHFESQDAPLEELDLADGLLEKTMEVNAYGPLRVTQQFLPLLELGRSKVIVNISSETGSVADCRRIREFSYCMSKSALNIESKLLHNYLAPRGYRVLVLHPGWVRTDMGGPNADISPDQSADGIFDLVTQGHLPPDEIYLDYAGLPLRW